MNSTGYTKATLLQRQLCIAVVDDDEDDRSFISSAFYANGNQFKVVEYEDGEHFLDAMIAGENSRKIAENCALIILDINMHKLNGLEVLDRVKAQAALRHIPVVMFSTSTDRELVYSAYTRGASSYVQKPNRMEGYKQIVQSLQTCFLSLPCVRTVEVNRINPVR
ncbi:response regulator [Tellurirhabdus rosea]|uniref:response regulator n=1 Tax=Tellurirhabdus rosea TaxID=2674997 RepID=UPI002257765C|nr:response regulator [Tellurirhabdus rosea]